MPFSKSSSEASVTKSAVIGARSLARLGRRRVKRLLVSAIAELLPRSPLRARHTVFSPSLFLSSLSLNSALSSLLCQGRPSLLACSVVFCSLSAAFRTNMIGLSIHTCSALSFLPLARSWMRREKEMKIRGHDTSNVSATTLFEKWS